MAASREDRSEQQVVEFLGRLLEQRVPAVRSQYSAEAPRAFAYPQVEEFFEMDGEEAGQLLEELAAEGLLDRRLAHKVHLCPGCRWHTLNFVEVCPRCRSIDIEIENVIHHFACAYVGAWSEFRQGVDLVCPKCGDQLRHLGLDYERPADTYVCRECSYVFTESAVEAQCLRCNHAENAEKLRPRRIYDYVPNPKTHRAVEYGRIQGLDIESVLFQDSSRAFRRDFLIFEIDRELYRARRYDSPLSMALIDVRGFEHADGVHGEADVERLRAEMLEQVAGALRDLDVVSTVEETWAAVLLPETPLEAAMAVGQRLHRSISEYQSVSLAEPLAVTVAVGELGEEHEEGRQFFEYVRRVLAWARESRPGTVVSAQTWKEEAPDA